MSYKSNVGHECDGDKGELVGTECENDRDHEVQST